MHVNVHSELMFLLCHVASGIFHPIATIQSLQNRGSVHDIDMVPANSITQRDRWTEINGGDIKYHRFALSLEFSLSHFQSFGLDVITVN
jgi:hypothetical protein